MSKMSIQGYLTALTNDNMLQNIPEDTILSCAHIIWGSGRSRHGEMIGLPLLVGNLAELRFGGHPTKQEKAHFTQLLLQALSREEFQEGVHYVGHIGMRHGKYTGGSKVYVGLGSLNTILMCSTFDGDHMVEQFRFVLSRAYAVREQYMNAYQEHCREKKKNLCASANCRRELGNALEKSGVNPRFGISAIADKIILGALVPGPGSQRKKIAQARDIDEFKGGSCSAELNPGSQGYRTFAIDRANHCLSNDPTFMSPSATAAEKRKRVKDVFSALTKRNKARYQGVSDEENARLNYSVDKDVEKRLLNSPLLLHN
eukprot:gene38033-46212_t